MLPNAVNTVNAARGSKAGLGSKATAQAPAESAPSSPAASTSSSKSTPSNSMGTAAKVAEKMGAAPQAQPQTSKTKSAPAEAKPEATDAETAEAIRKLKLKLNGRELELPEADVIALAQMGGSARAKWEEAARLRKEAEAREAKLKNKATLREGLKELGYSDEQIRELATEVISHHLNDEMLSPEERAFREREAQLKARERELEEFQAKQKEAQLQQMTQYWSQQYDKQITETLQKHKMPADAYMIKKMAAMMQDAIENKIPASWDDIVTVLKPEVFSHHQHMLSHYEADILTEAVSKEVLKKLRDQDLAKFKSPHKVAPAKIVKQSMSSARESSKKLAKDDWKARMERIKRGEE